MLRHEAFQLGYEVPAGRTIETKIGSFLTLRRKAFDIQLGLLESFE
jgi:hypothetical protein